MRYLVATQAKHQKNEMMSQQLAQAIARSGLRLSGTLDDEITMIENNTDLV